jgi:hypothetical protein
MSCQAVRVKPEIFVGFAHQKFAAEAQCTDAVTRAFVQAQMDARAVYVRTEPASLWETGEARASRWRTDQLHSL